MSSIVTDFRPERFINKQGREVFVYVPVIDLILHASHKYSPKIECYVDTGAYYNIFPEEIATSFFGMTTRSLRRGIELPIMGVGGHLTTAYGFSVEINHPCFKFPDTIYFLKDQPYPLLGRNGFMNHFEKVVFNEENKKLELIL